MFIHVWTYSCQTRVPYLEKRVITGFRLKINNSSNKTGILTNWINYAHNSCISSWFAGLFFLNQLLLGYHDFHGQQQNIITRHSQGWLRQLNYLEMSSRSSLWYISVFKSRQGKQCRREKQMANELSLLVWWLTWAKLVYLLTYLQKRNFMLVAAILYIMYI